ncbi:hypothetical protein [Prosthecomicrobium hirschii]|uniref:hypothetical protein n=1 Tax=Prosthecodimorpha hirschii TaxID=665126 RepID=UPI00128FAB5B|nr:hypothetical protein [Prosthecomicrobium hirschii]
MILVERQAPAGALKTLRTASAHIGHENPYCGTFGCAGFSDRSIETPKSIYESTGFTQYVIFGKLCLAKWKRDMNIGKYCRVFILQKYFDPRAWFVGFRRSTDETAWLLPGAAHDGGGG